MQPRNSTKTAPKKRTRSYKSPVRLVNCFICGDEARRDDLQWHLDTRHPGWVEEMYKKIQPKLELV